MSKPAIFSFIKTPCGRAKYLELKERKSLISRIRFYWFILFAALRDLPLINPDQIDESKS